MPRFDQNLYNQLRSAQNSADSKRILDQWWQAHTTDVPHLDGANLEGAHLDGVYLSRPPSHVRISSPSGAQLNGAHLEGAQLNGAHLEGAQLNEAHLEGAQLNEAHLEGAALNSANLQKAQLNKANLWGAHLNGAHLRGAQLNEAHLEGAHLRDANIQDSQLNGASLSEAHLINAYLLRDELNGADLEGAVLSDADLRRTQLHGADLRRAELHRAKLRECQLYGARLEEAHLEATVFSQVILHGVYARYAIVDGGTLFTDCRINDINDETDFTGVGLDNARIDEWTKARLKGNNRKHYWTGYRYHPKRWSPEQGRVIDDSEAEVIDHLSWYVQSWKNRVLQIFVRPFWGLSDYGRSTGRVIFSFFTIAIIFAAFYLMPTFPVPFGAPNWWLTQPSVQGLETYKPEKIPLGTGTRVVRALRYYWWPPNLRPTYWWPTEPFIQGVVRGLWNYWWPPNLRPIYWWPTEPFVQGLATYKPEHPGSKPEDIPVGTQVVRALYFSVVAMTTLGFGDITAHPLSVWGHVLVMLQVLMGYVLLGALITRLAILFQGVA